MSKKSAVISISLLCVFILLLGALSTWLYVAYESPEELAAKENVRTLRADLAEANTQLEERRQELTTLQSHLADRMTQIEELEHKVSVLLDADEASDEYAAILLAQISALKEDAASSAERIEELEELIFQYENITTLNFGYQAKKISDLLLSLAEPNRPTRTLRTETTDSETGETVTVFEETVPAELAFYYRDITTGYTLSYNSTEVMYSASLIKAPYIYSVLKSVSEFEDRKLHFDAEGNPLYDEEGNPLFEGTHPNLDEEGRIIYAEGEEKYDLSRIWTFNKEAMMRDGSGYLKDMDDGTQMTYLELIEYTLLYSDNIAFAEIREVFGYSDYYALASSLGVRGYANGFMRLSADDCGKFMEAIYAFTENDAVYGAFMKQAMMESNYAVLIPYAVAPTESAHKYGWDVESYHDMAIVYDEHPFILVILTDLDQGGTTVNAYIHDVIRAINNIHKNFYAE